MDGREIDDEIGRYVSRFGMGEFLNASLLANLRLTRHEAFTTILTEWSKARFLYFLVEGRLQCTHYHSNGKAAVLALTDPFAAIGDLEVLSDQPIRSNVITTQPTTLLGIPNTVVERYGANDPRLLRFLLDEIRKKLIESNAVQMSHVLPVASRLALYILARVGDDVDRRAQGRATVESKKVVLPNKESLASLLGATPRHLNRVLNDLVADHAIENRYPTVRVLDRLALEAIVEY